MALFKEERQTYSGPSTQTVNLGKVFGVMFLGILLTALISIGWAYFLSTRFLTYDNSTGLINIDENIFPVIIPVSIVAFLAMMISSAIVNYRGIRSDRPTGILIPFIVYGVSVGLLLGLLVMLCDPMALVVSLGVTVLIYGLLALIGILSKGNMNGLVFVASALFIGCFLLALINLLLIPLLSLEAYSTFFWIITFGIFAAILLTTIWDVWQINKMISGAPVGLNLTLYCAFRLYTDFIAIFVRVLYFVLLVFGKSRR